MNWFRRPPPLAPGFNTKTRSVTRVSLPADPFGILAVEQPQSAQLLVHAADVPAVPPPPLSQSDPPTAEPQASIDETAAVASPGAPAQDLPEHEVYERPVDASPGVAPEDEAENPALASHATQIVEPLPPEPDPEPTPDWLVASGEPVPVDDDSPFRWMSQADQTSLDVPVVDDSEPAVDAPPTPTPTFTSAEDEIVLDDVSLPSIDDYGPLSTDATATAEPTARPTPNGALGATDAPIVIRSAHAAADAQAYWMGEEHAVPTAWMDKLGVPHLASPATYMRELATLPQSALADAAVAQALRAGYRAESDPQVRLALLDAVVFAPSTPDSFLWYVARHAGEPQERSIAYLTLFERGDHAAEESALADPSLSVAQAMAQRLERARDSAHVDAILERLHDPERAMLIRTALQAARSGG